MKVVQLGEIAGPVMAFGRPASNLQAVMALMGQAARRGVAREAASPTLPEVTSTAGISNRRRGNGLPDRLLTLLDLVNSKVDLAP
ncbi:hypothetical protein [Mangrovicoccus ximenensis]|uniref:hypothetical protein n=1 Tax=Mangrovicoccus ximenensis TaxID=1911570 RepID=UPI000D333AE3|nr:hypothetical protein [Mangrovicoccus ximenensis]